MAEGRLGVDAGYDDKVSADGDVENAKPTCANMTEFVTGGYNVGEGEEILGYDYR